MFVSEECLCLLFDYFSGVLGRGSRYIDPSNFVFWMGKIGETKNVSCFCARRFIKNIALDNNAHYHNVLPLIFCGLLECRHIQPGSPPGVGCCPNFKVAMDVTTIESTKHS